MAKADRVSHSGEEGKSDAFSVDVEQSMATLEARGRHTAASTLVGDLNPALGFCFPLFSTVFPWENFHQVETCGSERK
jgi:hypothetical protein